MSAVTIAAAGRDPESPMKMEEKDDKQQEEEEIGRLDTEYDGPQGGDDNAATTATATATAAAGATLQCSTPSPSSSFKSIIKSGVDDAAVTNVGQDMEEVHVEGGDKDISISDEDEEDEVIFLGEDNANFSGDDVLSCDSNVRLRTYTNIKSLSCPSVAFLKYLGKCREDPNIFRWFQDDSSTIDLNHVLFFDEKLGRVYFDSFLLQHKGKLSGTVSIHILSCALFYSISWFRFPAYHVGNFIKESNGKGSDPCYYRIVGAFQAGE